jgi:uncharacterized RDD family membrane protein YckC
MSFWRPPTYRPLTSAECTERASAQAPSLRRRLTAFVYEGVLLFGIVVPVALVYGVLTNQRHGMEGRLGLGLTLFATLLIYFVWCWRRSGQTLAMKTWHLQLVDAGGARPPIWRAMLRHLLSWLWFAPSLVAAWAFDWHSTGQIMGALVGWIGVYSLLSYLLPRRQFLHDVLSGTRLIDARP